MRIIAVGTLRKFWKQHADTEQSLRAWYHEVSNAQWLSPSDILNDFPRARPISNNRCIFNINGNNYRLIVQIHYNRGIAYIRFIGTHAAYDKIDALKI